MKKVKIDGLADAIQEELTLYGSETVAEVKKVARRNINRMRNETKQQKYKNQGQDYLNAIATKTTEESVNHIVLAWYVKPPHYRLSHLLEHGHLTASGTRTVAYKTITKAEENAVENYLKELEEVLSK